MLKKLAGLLACLGIAFGAMMLFTAERSFEVDNRQVVAHPAASVWAVLADVDRWPAWWPGVEEARLESGWRPGAALALVLKGTPERRPARIEAVVAGRRMSWVRDGVLGSLTRTSLDLEPLGGETRVTLKSTIHGPQAFMAGLTGKEEFAMYHRAVLTRLELRLDGGGPVSGGTP
ncbi:MAG: hypothetical protein C0617_10700 [Desulfuromonas sp.]|uniref:SRPBCC family protein n=1 Tax=Desulfuromonas sp. TaxID=892 RepID=UPI000CBEF3FB|nr:SRPBCC family protein [Desulfuromonas sp.]PLX83601.1 MAG: hypothetical protein C0617_10700 [Desulfuromonas sp.]